MTEQDFQKEVITRLTTIEIHAEHTKDHLAKLNGKVASHEKELGERRLELITHISTCPNAHRIEALEKVNTADDVKAATNNRWVDRLTPLAYWFLGALSLALLSHGEALLKYLP